MARFVDTLVIGAGQAGLAASYDLSNRGVRHLVVERGEVGGSWLSRRWDSFRLVTPNWCCRLPGARAEHDDRDGFMTGGEMAAALHRFALAIRAPVECGIHISALEQTEHGLLAHTRAGRVRASNVVVATGAYQRPCVPGFSRKLDPVVMQLTSDGYRCPDQLPAGGVLVVGSGQSGVQIADELIAAGRRVHLSVGRCGWVPRRYRGRDIAGWLVDMGMLERPRAALRSPEARLACFPQLSGVDGGKDVNVHTLAAAGAILLGRVCGAEPGTVHLAPDLAADVRAADAFAAEVKRRIDSYARGAGLDQAAEDDWPVPTGTPDATSALGGHIDLDSAGIRSVIWACGYRPDFSWIRLPIFDRLGFPIHARGVSQAPGLYFIGLPWLHKWKSATLLGVGEDAEFIAKHIAQQQYIKPEE